MMMIRLSTAGTVQISFILKEQSKRIQKDKVKQKLQDLMLDQTLKRKIPQINFHLVWVASANTNLCQASLI